MAYLDVTAFRALTLAPASYVDAIEVAHAGWLLGRLTHWSDRIDARLRKRYAVPFAASPLTPPIITGWLEALVTFELYAKRGVDATDSQIVEMRQRFDATLAELKEAADSRDGLLELPLRSDNPTSAVTKAGPQGYSEASPYDWISNQLQDIADQGT